MSGAKTATDLPKPDADGTKRTAKGTRKPAAKRKVKVNGAKPRVAETVSPVPEADASAVTVITSTKPEKVHKRFWPGGDGKLAKTSVANIVEGTAQRQDVPDVDAMVRLLKEVTQRQDQVIVAGRWHGCNGAPFRVVPEATLATMLGKPEGDAELGGVLQHNGELIAARLKRGIDPAAWVLFDADNPPGMPADWAAMSIQQRLELWEALLPGVSTVERIELRGSSARVHRVGEKPGPVSHAWLRVDDPSAIERMRSNLQVAMVTQDLSFLSPRYSRSETGKVIGHESRTLFDLAVFVTGRLTFCARPDCESVGYSVADADIRVINRGAGPLRIAHLKLPTEAESQAYYKKTGVKLAFGKNGVGVTSHGQLTPDTEIERRGTTKRLAEWLAQMKPGDKLRCEAPFRASQSEAGVIVKNEDGSAIVHDVGVGTTYVMEAPRRNDDGPVSPEGSEDAIALEVVRDHGHELRYVAEISKWYRWDGYRWAEDRTVTVYDVIRPFVRRAALALDTKAQQRKAASNAMVAGVERLMRTDRAVAALADDFDTNPWLLNTPGGMVDLRTGVMRPGDPAAMCSKVTAVTPAPPGTRAPLFERFLAEITGESSQRELVNDNRLSRYLQRACGYSLTGSTKEHALFFPYGPGGNGKGTLVNAMLNVMGDYAKPVPAEIFLATEFDRHPAELADLRGARMIVASEINTDQKWNEARIKALTGGDPISARFMRGNPFTFIPQFKPWIVGNNQPGLSSVDEAIRRRMNLIPFTIAIPEKDRDKDLPEKLRDEWPAILRWAIDGCLEWRLIGLKPPPCVREATGDYLSSEDTLGQWLEECCERHANAFSSSVDLYGSWRNWAGARGVRFGNQKDLVSQLQKRGFERCRKDGNGSRGLRGLQLTM